MPLPPPQTVLWLTREGTVRHGGSVALSLWQVAAGEQLLARVDMVHRARVEAALGAEASSELAVRLVDGRTLAVAFAPAPGCTEVAAVDITETVQRGRDGDLIFELSNDLVCTATTDGRFLRLSPSVHDILGYAPEDILRREFINLVHPDDQPATLRELATLAEGGVTVGFTNRYRHANGDWRSLQWAATPDVESGLIYAIARDVTEELALRAALAVTRDAAESASRAKSAFLAHMSHELRTPLNAIIGYSEMIVDEAEDDGAPTGVLDDVRTILEAGHQLLMLINGILDVSKIEAGRVELFLEQVSLVDVLNTVEATIRPIAERRGNAVRVTHDGPPWLLTDRLKLQQILLNLLANAARFTDHGTVSLDVRLDGDGVALVVSDDGIGMSDDDIGRVFAPFEQASASIGARFGGTGLGLFIARRFATLLGGSIRVESALGSGTTFTVWLPRGGLARGADAQAVTGGYLVVVEAPREAADARVAAASATPGG